MGRRGDAERRDGETGRRVSVSPRPSSSGPQFVTMTLPNFGSRFSPDFLRLFNCNVYGYPLGPFALAHALPTSSA